MKKIYPVFATAFGSALCCVAAMSNQLLLARTNRKGVCVKEELLVPINRPNPKTHPFLGFALVTCCLLASEFTFAKAGQTFLTSVSYMTITMHGTFHKVTVKAWSGFFSYSKSVELNHSSTLTKI